MDSNILQDVDKILKEANNILGKAGGVYISIKGQKINIEDVRTDQISIRDNYIEVYQTMTGDSWDFYLPGIKQTKDIHTDTPTIDFGEFQLIISLLED